MKIVDVVSAIGNNKSVYPLLVRDCGIEVPTKIAMTYNQNKEDKQIAKLSARERFIDEYAVSAVWLGGIPLIDKAAKPLIAKVKGLNDDVNIKLLSEEEKYAKALKNAKKTGEAVEPIVQGLEYNINKFAGKKGTEDAIKDLINVKNNKKLFAGLMNTKFIASIIIPIGIMGFVIPKMVFASTAKKMEKYKQQTSQSNEPAFTANKTFEPFTKSRQNMTSFQGSLTSVLANMTTVQKMAVTDGGYAAGRIITARKKNEAVDLAFKMSGMMFLNFAAPVLIEKMFNHITDINLDPKILTDKRFLAKVKYNNLELPKSNSAKDMLDFIDENPKAVFTQQAAKFDHIKLLKNDVRDPRAYVDINKLAKFKQNIEKFAQKATQSGNVKKYAQKALYLRSLTILTNIGLSSFLLAYCLPKAQFLFREWYTGSKLEPGLVDDK